MRSRITPLALATVMASAMLLGIPGKAGAWVVQGGRTLAPQKMAVDVGVGFPEIRGTFRIGILDNFEIAPNLAFYYFRDVAPSPAVVMGNRLAVELKVNLLDEGPLQLAFVGEPGVVFNYFRNFNVGLHMSPGVLLSYEFTDQVAIFGGMKMPLQIYFAGFGVALPILVEAGVEYKINEQIHLFYAMDMGPDLIMGVNRINVRFYLSALFGVTIHL